MDLTTRVAVITGASSGPLRDLHESGRTDVHLHISSGAGRKTSAGGSGHCANKAAVVRLRGLANQRGEWLNVDVGCVEAARRTAQ